MANFGTHLASIIFWHNMISWDLIQCCSHKPFVLSPSFDFAQDIRKKTVRPASGPVEPLARREVLEG